MNKLRRQSATTDDDLADEGRLGELGYKQELRRDWGLIHNFGVSFSIISVITGITTLFQYGLTTGGPAVMTVGWIIVSFFTFFIALAMAEITSAHPTAGGPYFWAAMLAPNNYLAAFFSWVTGWFNFVGQFAVTTGIVFGCANLIATLATVKSGFVPTPVKIVGIHAAILVSMGLVNTFGVRYLRYLNNTSIVLHSLGIASFAIAVVAAAPTHKARRMYSQSSTMRLEIRVGASGLLLRKSSLLHSIRLCSHYGSYVACIGILFSQYTLTGFDASAHLSEETHNASRSAPYGVLMSVGVSALFGFFLILCLLFSIQDFDATVGSEYLQPVLQILLDIFGENGAIALFTLIIVCVWHCGLFSITSNSRMFFSFSRDRGIPHFFHHVDKRFKSPTRTIWLAVLLAFLLALPSLGSSVAFAAATSIATIGLYISYGIPIMIGLIWHKNFVKGPFNLGVLSRPIAAVACLWIGFITIVFCLPSINPVTSQTVNYSCVAVGIVGIFAMGSWFLWAHRWFTGPIRQIEAEALGIDIDTPGALEQLEMEKEKNGAAAYTNGAH
ncbi:polyamine transporter tpo5 [Oleoguttula sp. CCFEE 5521]